MSTEPAVRSAQTGQDVTSLRDLSPQQWKSGIAAWLGWLFDGLDMHLYTLVATPFVAQLLQVGQTDDAVGYYSSVIQAAFLVGWALGGGFFGRLGDRLGRARALILTILTYALFTGLSFFAQTWWQLMLCRFLAALGIGGEWAVGASLLSETWPRRWRPWIAATLQSAVNIGVLLAMVAGVLVSIVAASSETYAYRSVFLVGILPALLVLWIRKAVPEPEEWHAAKLAAQHVEPSILDLFRGSVRRTTILTILVCATSLTAHWAFMFWSLQHLRNLPDVKAWTDLQRTTFVSNAMILLMVTSIAGNFLAALIARFLGYRRTICLMCLAYFCSMYVTYSVARSHDNLFWCLCAMGVCQGVFGLFTMYMPPLFPTLLRTTGAGFCYNIGRIVAAAGTVFFGLFSKVGDHRLALLYAAWLFLPAAGVALLLPEPPDEKGTVSPAE
ncbi:MAG: MFS transporter [Pirellulaceae bacterium]|nr:MFS transporter [Pirellulaceae bacterium]